jgi:GTP-binding protein Era
MSPLNPSHQPPINIPTSRSGYVALIGRPNSGKSTLLNQVLKTEISVVTPKAQTTRERILGIYTEEEGQIVFMDTPGIHQAKTGGINEYMMTEARQAMDSPQLIWYLVDPNSVLHHEMAVLDLLKGSRSPVLILMNKWDWAERKFPLPQLEMFEKTLTQKMTEYGIELKGIRRISGLSGAGVNDLLKETWTYIPIGHHYYPDPEQVSDRPVRFFVAEKIRGRLFWLLGDEVPYSCAIAIENFDENSNPPRIEAVIYVERDSQKGIVIGQGGKKIKEIGQSARAEIEEFLGQKIFLGLKVKVLKDWSRDADLLKKMGYHLP